MGVNKWNDRYVVSRYWPDGTRYRRVQPSYAVAKKTMARIEESIAMGSWRELRAELTGAKLLANPSIAEFAEIYLEQYCRPRNRHLRFKEARLRVLIPALGNIRLKDLTRGQVYEFVARRSNDVSNATVNRDVAVLRNLCTFAVERGILEHNPLFGFKSLPVQEKPRRILTPEEFRGLVEAVAEYSHVCGAYVAILGETGLRKSEGLNLQWPDLDLETLLLTVRESKSGRVRRVPISEYALCWLRSLERIVGLPWVFLVDGRRRLVDPRKSFYKGREEVDLEWVGFHDLRHFRATQWVRQGMDITLVQGLLGHSRISTTQIYSHFDLDYARDKAREISQKEEANFREKRNQL